MLISTRADDVRAAQQLSTLAGLPSVALATLIAVNVIPPRAPPRPSPPQRWCCSTWSA